LKKLENFGRIGTGRTQVRGKIQSVEGKDLMWRPVVSMEGETVL
jgi:hypothetical protein